MISFEEFMALQYTPRISYIPSFFNLSSHSLTQFESIFNLGMKHIPRPLQTTDKEIKESINDFVNGICWDHFFTKKDRLLGKTNEYDPNLTPFEKQRKRPKPYLPKQGYEEVDYLPRVTSQITDRYLQDNPAIRLPDPLQKLKQYMKDNPSLKLVSADKNLGFVALDISQYNDLVAAHLENNRTIYVMIEKNNQALMFYLWYRRALEEYKRLYQELFDKDSEEYLYLKSKLSASFTLPKFHVLPKLHKGFTPLASRPIVGAVNWITSPFSRVLSKKLRPFVTEPWIMTNSQNVTARLQRRNMMWKLNGNPHRRPILVTLDVQSLYTNIKTEILGELLEQVDPKFKKIFDFLNKHNYFEYDEKIMKQIQGIAMGTNYAPEGANLYLKLLIDVYLNNCEFVSCFCRLIDDLFFIWTDGETNLERFIMDLQEAVPGIRFDPKYSYDSVDFLDLTIKMTKYGRGYWVEHPRLEYYTHQKQLNRYSYISPSSCHPTHTFRGFITAELTRYRRNSSHLYYYNITKNLFYKRLVMRGYPRALLKSIFKSHSFIPKPKTKVSNNDRLHPLILRYSFRKNIGHFAQSILASTRHLQKAYFQRRYLIAWSKSSNLYGLLNTSGLTKSQSNLVKTVNDNRYRPLSRVGPRRFRLN
jgi:hypothetical protein